MKTKTAKIWFWVVTLLLTAAILGSAVPSVLMLPYAIDHFTNHLGYPAYFLFFTGLTKLLGLVAILWPGFPKIKEWAYAGFVFDLVGAIYSSIAVGDPFNSWVVILIDLVLLIISYLLSRRIYKDSGAYRSKLAVQS